MGVFGCVMCFLMCQCVRMPRSVSGQDVWSLMCVMLGFAGVWMVCPHAYSLKALIICPITKTVLKNKEE